MSPGDLKAYLADPLKYAARRRFVNAAIAYFQLGGNCKAELDAILEALRQATSEREPEPGSGEMQP